MGFYANSKMSVSMTAYLLHAIKTLLIRVFVKDVISLCLLMTCVLVCYEDLLKRVFGKDVLSVCLLRMCFLMCYD